jgi:hypothetical protein
VKKTVRFPFAAVDGKHSTAVDLPEPLILLGERSPPRASEQLLSTIIAELESLDLPCRGLR